MLGIKEKAIIKFLIFIVALAVWVKFFVGPMLKKNRRLSEEIISSEERLLSLGQILERKKDIKDVYAKYFTKSDSGFVDEPTVEAFKELEALAKKYSVKIIDIRQGPISSRQSEEIIIDLKLEAGERDYIRFIHGLKESNLLFRVKRFDLRPKKDTSWLEVRLAIAFFPSS